VYNIVGGNSLFYDTVRFGICIVITCSYGFVFLIHKQPGYRISITQESTIMLKIYNNTGLLYVHRDELSHARKFVLLY